MLVLSWCERTVEGKMALVEQVEKASATDCPRCRRIKGEVYLYLYNTYEFDVDRARVLVSDGREALEIEEESVRTAVERSDIDDCHIPHVNTDYPGIIAHLFHRTPDGEVVGAHLLIDGNHRAARCLREQRPFFAYLLSEEESRAILLRSPEKLGTNFGITSPPDEADDAGDLQEETTHAYEERFADSLPLWQRASKVIAGTSTHDRRGFGPFGVYVDRAEGPLKWDVSGRPLIDLWMGHGSLIQGHGFAPVVEAVQRQMLRGTHPGACHELEVRWAELVCAMIPSAQRVRFTASGTEAVMLALRIARSFTGRRRIIKFDGHFHGWHDEAMCHFFETDSAGFNPGAVEQVGLADPSDAASAVRLLEKGDVAAVLLEPGGGSSGSLPWGREFLQTLREATRAHGALLIFDEVISGFRYAPGGVQALTGVLPDLTTLAKILSGGLPGGAVAGSEEVMAVLGAGTRRGERKAQVPHTGTFNGNPLSAAAGIALLEHVRDGVAQHRARRAAERLVRGVNAAASEHQLDVRLFNNDASIYHILIGARKALAPLGPSQALAQLHRANPRKYALLRRTLLVEGVDSPPIHGWLSAVHDDATIDAVVQAFDRAFARLEGVAGFRR
jgi:glutamate-1-semialdehyde 2,1-aminomutase